MRERNRERCKPWWNKKGDRGRTREREREREKRERQEWRRELERK